jgi:hypothetical protein
MNETTGNKSSQAGDWSELFLKEDWWAIWLGLGIILVAWVFFEMGSSIKWLAVTPEKWASLSAFQIILFPNFSVTWRNSLSGFAYSVSA